jgi:hypothetical protein
MKIQKPRAVGPTTLQTTILSNIMSDIEKATIGDSQTLTGTHFAKLTTLFRQHSQAHSVNLYQWLKRNRSYNWAVMTDKDGQLFIGIVHGSNFSGANMNRVLALGAREKVTTGKYSGTIVIVNGWWDRYIEKGQCIMDPQHIRKMPGDANRYAVGEDGLTRCCKWCGAGFKQRPMKVIEIKDGMTWAPVEDPDTCKEIQVVNGVATVVVP